MSNILFEILIYVESSLVPFVQLAGFSNKKDAGAFSVAIAIYILLPISLRLSYFLPIQVAYMTELTALVDALPFSVLLVSERYLTARPSWSLLLGARQQVSMITPIFRRRGEVHARNIVSI